MVQKSKTMPLFEITVSIGLATFRMSSICASPDYLDFYIKQ